MVSLCQLGISTAIIFIPNISGYKKDYLLEDQQMDSDSSLTAKQQSISQK